MSDRLTEVYLPGDHANGRGVADWGRKSHADMVKMLKEKAAIDKEFAEKILAADNSEFIVNTYVGMHARKNIERIMP